MVRNKGSAGADLRERKLKGLTTMSANDMDNARSTYDSFMGTLKWTVPLIAIIAFIVIALIAP